MSFGPLFQSQPCFTYLGCQHYKPNRFSSSYSKETGLMKRENAKGKRNLPHVAAFQDLLEPVYKIFFGGGEGGQVKPPNGQSDSHSYVGIELLWQLKRKMRVKPPCSRMSVGQEVWARRRKTMGNNLFPRSSSFFALLHQVSLFCGHS